MEKDEIVNGTDEPTLATWIHRFTMEYGKHPTRMSDLAAFVEEREQNSPSSGQIARHDPERMAQAQRAGEMYTQILREGLHSFCGSSSNEEFILGVLATVRDGKI